MSNPLHDHLLAAPVSRAAAVSCANTLGKAMGQLTGKTGQYCPGLAADH
jgi:hypothetical protein